MPLYEYKCSICGEIHEIREDYSEKSHHRIMSCNNCKKLTEFKWQFPLSRFKFAEYQGKELTQRLLDGEARK